MRGWAELEMVAVVARDRVRVVGCKEEVWEAAAGCAESVAAAWVAAETEAEVVVERDRAVTARVAAAWKVAAMESGGGGGMGGEGGGSARWRQGWWRRRRW